VDRNSHQPPPWLLKLFNRFVDEYYIDSIYGDLYEDFQNNIESRKPRLAKLKFILNGLMFLIQNFRIKADRKQSNMSLDILISSFIVSIRYFKKQKAYFLFNLLGLSIGLIAGIFIWKYVKYETSYDNFHKAGIFRIVRNIDDNGMANTKPDLAPLIKQRIPLVKEATRFFIRENGSVSIASNADPTILKGITFLYADENFFSVFTFTDNKNTNNYLKDPTFDRDACKQPYNKLRKRHYLRIL